MAYITTYQGNTLSLSLSLTNQDGSPYNASGCVLCYTATSNYETAPLFNVCTTGVGPNLANALTGLLIVNLSTGNTAQCCQQAVAGFTLIDVFTGVTYIPTDGLNILPSPYFQR